MHAWLTREAKLESYIMQKMPLLPLLLFHWSQVRILLFTFIFQNCGALKLVRNSALKIVWTHLWETVMNVVTLVLNNREVQLDNKPSTQIIDKGEEAAEEDKWKIPAEASKDANDEDKTVHSSVSWKMIRKLWLKKKYAWYWRPTHDEKKMDKKWGCS